MGGKDMGDKMKDLIDKAQKKLRDESRSEEEAGDPREHRDRDAPEDQSGARDPGHERGREGAGGDAEDRDRDPFDR